MKRARLLLPQRLARHALDHAKADLAAAVDRGRNLEDALRTLRDARTRERAGEAAALQPLASFLERSRQHERDLLQELEQVRRAKARLTEVLQQRHQDLRRLERLDERLARRDESAKHRRDQRELDDLIRLRRTGR